MNQGRLGKGWLGAVALGLASAIGAVAYAEPGFDRELAAAVETARDLFKQGQPGDAEEHLEELAGRRVGDARAWLVLGNLRLALGAHRAMRQAYRQAQILGDAGIADRIRTKLREAGQAPLPDPVVHLDEARFRSLAAAETCALRRSRGVSGACPSGGLVVGRKPCSLHGPQRPRDDEESWRVDRALLAAARDEGEGWVRERAVHHAGLADLMAEAPAWRDEADPEVRRVLLQRLMSRAGSLSATPGLDELPERFAEDPDPAVRHAAWTLLHLEGRTPTPEVHRFSELLEASAKGRVSPLLVREVFSGAPHEYLPALARALAERRFGAQVPALMLALRHGGAEGAELVNRAFARPTQVLADLKGLLQVR